MLFVGLTGGIGSGKSTVAEIFKTLGIPVFDADKEAKRLMEQNEEVRLQVQQQFGSHIYAEGILNRKALADLVFSDTYLLNKLNAIVHPVAIVAAKQWATQQNAPYLVKEAALLFEAGSAGHLQYIIGVSAPQALRINRVMKRDQSSRQQVLDRMKRQIDENIKLRLCDFVLVNDEQQLLTTQVLELHQKLISLS